MQKTKLNTLAKYSQAGFTTVEISIVVAVLIIVAGVGIAVESHHKPTATINLAESKNTQTSKPTIDTGSSTPKASTVSTQTTSSSSPKSSSSSTSSSKTTTSSTTKQTAPTSQPSTPAPTTTPLDELTSIISGLDAGQSAEVTASNVTIPGPISDATGRPIVFTVNGTTYFAYTQEHVPNLNQSSSQAASTFAIVNATTSAYSLTQSHIDKTGLLVDENSEGVGYSTGGD